MTASSGPAAPAVSEGSTTLYSQTRTYDNVGNVLGLATTTRSSSGSAVTENEAFCYDALSRLVWAGNTGTPSGGDHCMSAPSASGVSFYSQAYSYDSLDRITSGPAGTYTYGDSTHVHAATGISTVPNPYAAYDAMGNLICRNSDTTSGHTCAGSSPTGAVMSCDNEGRLTGWTAPSGTNASEHLLYDNEGNLVLTRATTTTGTTSTINFGLTETVLTSNSTTTTNSYFVAGQRVAEQVGSTFSYLVPNLEGSPTVALDSTGHVSAVQLFLPYGAQGFAWGSMPTAHSYTDQLLDRQMSLLYYGARFYDPLSDQFVSADAVLNNAEGWNPYAYVAGNPETFVDPTGHFMEGSGGAVGAIGDGDFEFIPASTLDEDSAASIGAGGEDTEGGIRSREDGESDASDQDSNGSSGPTFAQEEQQWAQDLHEQEWRNEQQRLNDEEHNTPTGNTPTDSNTPTDNTPSDNTPTNSNSPQGWESTPSLVTPGVTNFTRTVVDENRNEMETAATFYENTGELQIGWTDKFNFRASFSDLVNWLGDSVQMITGYATSGFRDAYFSTEEQSLESLYNLWRIASRMGFNQATLQRLENPRNLLDQLWLVFER